MPAHSDLIRIHHVSRDRVVEDVKRIVAETMGISPEIVREQSALEADLGADSLDVIEITMEVEEHFDITVPDEVGDRIRTVSEIADGVVQLLDKTDDT
jgi:acyl carrier protein